jgi:hypothetical protein
VFALKGVLSAEFTLAGIAEILLYAVLDTVADDIVRAAEFALHIGGAAEVLEVGAFIGI